MTPLASIQKVSNIAPIEGADRIQLATVLGYRCVVRKDEFQINDLCVFVQPDTVMKEDQRWEFLSKNSWRIKLSKFKGVCSQGLVLPISTFSELNKDEIKEGQDITDIVGVSKYEKPAPKDLNAKGHLPSFLKKTDEPNLLSVPNWLELFRNKECEITLKMDGQSASFFLQDNEFGVCSRNLELKDGNNAFWNMARKYGIESKLGGFAQMLKLGNRLEKLPNLAIQAEVYGPGIQGNRMGAAENQIAVFNLWNSDARDYCHQSWLDAFCFDTQLPRPRVVWRGNFDFSMEKLQALANSLKYENGSPAEGIVIRPIEEVRTPEGERLSAKVISEEFLAKYGE